MNKWQSVVVEVFWPFTKVKVPSSNVRVLQYQQESYMKGPTTVKVLKDEQLRILELQDLKHVYDSAYLNDIGIIGILKFLAFGPISADLQAGCPLAHAVLKTRDSELQSSNCCHLTCRDKNTTDVTGLGKIINTDVTPGNQNYISHICIFSNKIRTFPKSKNKWIFYRYFLCVLEYFYQMCL